MKRMMKILALALLLLAVLACGAAAEDQPEDALVRLERAFEESSVALMKDVFDPALLRTIDISGQFADAALSPLKTPMTVGSLCRFFAPMADVPALLRLKADDLRVGARDLEWRVISKRLKNDEEAYMKVIITLEGEAISIPGGEMLYFRCRDGKWYISAEWVILEPERKEVTAPSSWPHNALDRMILGLSKLNVKAASKAFDPFLCELYGDTYAWFSVLLPIGNAGKLISDTLTKLSEMAKWADLVAQMSGRGMNLFPLYYDVLSCTIHGETAEMYVMFYMDGKIISPEGGTRVWFRWVKDRWYISEEGVEKDAPPYVAAPTPEDTLKKIGEGLETLDVGMIEEAFDPEIVRYVYTEQQFHNLLIRGVTGVNLPSASRIIPMLRVMFSAYAPVPVFQYEIFSSKISGDRAILKVAMQVDGSYFTATGGDNMFFREIDGEWYITYPTAEQYFEVFGNPCPHLGEKIPLEDVISYEYEADAASGQHLVIEIRTQRWSCADCGQVESTEERNEQGKEPHVADEALLCSLCGAQCAPPPAATIAPTATPAPTPTAAPAAVPTATPVIGQNVPAPTATPVIGQNVPAPTATPVIGQSTAAPTATPSAERKPIAREEGAYQHVTQQAGANSHVVAGDGDYSAAMAVDGKEKTSWQFSTKKVKLGKAALEITLQPGSTVDELWIKNGFWRITNGHDQYIRNSRPKEIAVGFLYDGESKYRDELEFVLQDDKERKDWQKLLLGRHENVSAVRIRIISIYTGTKYKTDVAISEVMTVEREGTQPLSAYKKLKKGSRSDAVLAMKERLQELGYFSRDAKMNNSYNDACVNRVKQFQRINGLPQTGVADQHTLLVIYSDAALPKPD